MVPNYKPEDLSRASEILSVLARHGFGQFLSGLPLDKLPGFGHIKDEGHRAEELPAARRLLLAMQSLGPTFVKLGQMLSTRPDALPADYIAEFETLQDQVPPFPAEQARAMIEEELGATIDTIFADFQDLPVASASIAQVHRARLHDGTEVAVKVQRPDIERLIRSDLNILYLLAQWLEGSLDLGLYTPVAIIEAFDRAISTEVDFQAEATSCELFRETLARIEGVEVPLVHRRLTGRRVLTMSWVHGHKLSEIDQTAASRALVMDRLVEASFEQIFVRGVFHGDPHPGNFVVDDESTITYLDFGLVGRITPEMRDTLVGLVVGVIFKDAGQVARTLYRAGSATGRVQLRALAADVQTLLDRYDETSLQEQDTGRIAMEVLELARDHSLQMPDDYAILARAQLTLDGVVRKLKPDWDLWEGILPFAKRLASERLDPQTVGGEMLKSTLSAATMLKDLPGQLDQVFLDLERGTFELTAKTPAVDQLTKTVARTGRALLFGMGISAFLISAAVLSSAVLIGGGAFGMGRMLGSIGAVFSLLAAIGLLGALAWNLFLGRAFRSVRWLRVVGLLPGFTRRDRSTVTKPTNGRDADDGPVD